MSDIPRSGYTSELNSLDDTVPSGQDPVKVLEVLRPAPGAYTLELIGTGGGAFAVDPLSLVWTGPFGQASGTNVGAAFPIGSSMVSITANDGRGGAASDSASITVRDTTAPKASAQLIATCRPEKTRVVFVSASDARMFAQRPPRGLR